MTERRQAEEISRSADRITDAVRELTFTLNRFLEHQERYDWLGSREYRTRGELPEEEAVRIALAATYEVREEMMGRGLGKVDLLPAPSPEEVRRRRKERRKRESRERS